MVALDHNRRDLLGEFAYFKDPNLAGPAPVDEDPCGERPGRGGARAHPELPHASIHHGVPLS